MGDRVGAGRANIQADAGALLLDFLQSRVTELVDQLLRERHGDANDPLIRSDKLGPNNRIVLTLIKRGELRGVLIGNRWHVRRSEWTRYVAKLESMQDAERLATEGRTAGSTGGEVNAAADDVLAELGFERRAASTGGRVSRRGRGASNAQSHRRRTS